MRQGSYQRRTIPANTGRMVKLPECTCFPRDHPREYGENTFPTHSPTTPQGPSPRIRGESTAAQENLKGVGTIPANTGRIVRSIRPVLRQRDHPREYGENGPLSRTIPSWMGPSPRIRGECAGAGPHGRIGGTIPANTGRIWQPSARLCWPRDHPREYGENLVGKPLDLFTQGPSPRIRGEFSTLVQRLLRVRTIPANTGRI